MKATAAKPQDTTPARREPMTHEQLCEFVDASEDHTANVDTSKLAFKEGDRVRVVKPEGIHTATSNEDSMWYSDIPGHCAAWSEDMDQFIGEEYELTDLRGPNGWYLTVPHAAGLPPELASLLGAQAAFIEDWLEPVEVQ